MDQPYVINGVLSEKAKKELIDIKKLVHITGIANNIFKNGIFVNRISTTGVRGIVNDNYTKMIQDIITLNKYIRNFGDEDKFTILPEPNNKPWTAMICFFVGSLVIQPFLGDYPYSKNISEITAKSDDVIRQTFDAFMASEAYREYMNVPYKYIADTFAHFCEYRVKNRISSFFTKVQVDMESVDENVNIHGFDNQKEEFYNSFQSIPPTPPIMPKTPFNKIVEESFGELPKSKEKLKLKISENLKKISHIDFVITYEIDIMNSIKNDPKSVIRVHESKKKYKKLTKEYNKTKLLEKIIPYLYKSDMLDFFVVGNLGDDKIHFKHHPDIEIDKMFDIIISKKMDNCRTFKDLSLVINNMLRKLEINHVRPYLSATKLVVFLELFRNIFLYKTKCGFEVSILEQAFDTFKTSFILQTNNTNQENSRFVNLGPIGRHIINNYVAPPTIRDVIQSLYDFDDVPKYHYHTFAIICFVDMMSDVYLGYGQDNTSNWTEIQASLRPESFSKEKAKRFSDFMIKFLIQESRRLCTKDTFPENLYSVIKKLSRDQTIFAVMDFIETFYFEDGANLTKFENYLKKYKNYYERFGKVDITDMKKVYYKKPFDDKKTLLFDNISDFFRGNNDKIILDIVYGVYDI